MEIIGKIVASIFLLVMIAIFSTGVIIIAGMDIFYTILIISFFIVLWLCFVLHIWGVKPKVGYILLISAVGIIILSAIGYEIYSFLSTSCNIPEGLYIYYSSISVFQNKLTHI